MTAINRCFRFCGIFILMAGIGLQGCGSKSVEQESSLPRERAAGVVTNTGRGALIVKDDAGAENKYHIIRGGTRYQPHDYRPEKDDKVSVIYYIRTRNDGSSRPIATEVTLVELNKNQIEIPVTGTIINLNRGNLLIQMPKYDRAQWFNWRNNVLFLPAGWEPKVGDAVRIINYEKMPTRGNIPIYRLLALESISESGD